MNAGTFAALAALLLPALPVAVARAAAWGDAARGEAIYGRCAACHDLEADRTGPHHCGLFGRRAGSVPGFAYSQAMRQAGFVWDAAALDRFLAAPMQALPGTTMTYAGVPDAQERADLIEYLRAATAGCASPPVR